MSWLFISGSQSIGDSASTSVLPVNIQGSFRLGLTGWISMQSKRLKSLLQHHSSKALILWCSAFFMIQLSHPRMSTGKTVAFDYTDLCWQSDVSAFHSLGLSQLSFQGTSILISWLQSPSAVILEPPQNKVSHYFHCFCIYLL